MADSKPLSEEKEARYTKKQLLRKERYKNQQLFIKVLLKDDERYTYKEVDQIIQDYLNRRIK